MPYTPTDTPTPLELWNSAPWYERLGMAVFLGAHLYLFVRVFIG